MKLQTVWKAFSRFCPWGEWSNLCQQEIFCPADSAFPNVLKYFIPSWIPFQIHFHCMKWNPMKGSSPLFLGPKPLWIRRSKPSLASDHPSYNCPNNGFNVDIYHEGLTIILRSELLLKWYDDTFKKNWEMRNHGLLKFNANCTCAWGDQNAEKGEVLTWLHAPAFFCWPTIPFNQQPPHSQLYQKYQPTTSFNELNQEN